MARTGAGSLYQRGNVWWVCYSHGGTTYRESSRSTSKPAAARLLKEKLGQIGNGTFIGPAADRVTFEDLSRMISDDYRAQRRKATKQLDSTLKRLARTFAGMRALDISSDRLTAYVKERQDEGYAPGTIRKDIAAIRRAFNLAIRAGHLTTKPYFPSVRVDDAREGFFTLAEVETVARGLGPDLGPVALFAAWTGWRKRECLGLTWARIDFDAGTVRLEATRSKNSEGRTFPFRALPRLEQLLLDQRERTRVVEKRTGTIVPYVFHRDGQPILSIRRTWNAACRSAGLEGAWFHDLRRSAVMHFERAGIPRSVAMKLTGHKTEGIYRRYAIADAVALAEGVAKLAQLHAKTEPESKKVVAMQR